MLSGRHADRGDLPTDSSVTQDVVGTGGLLDPERIETAQLVDSVNRLLDIPGLVGVDHQKAVRSDLVADQRGAAGILGAGRPNLHFEGVPASGHSLTTESLYPLVGVSEPTGRRRVGGISALAQFHLPRLAAGAAVLQDGQRFVLVQGVGDVPEVDAAHHLFGAHVRQQLPQGFALELGHQVPDGIDDGCRGQVHDALLGPEPTELAVAGEATPEGPGVIAKLVEAGADDQGLIRRNRRHRQLVAPSAGKRQAVALLTATCSHGHVGGRIIWLRVERVAAVVLHAGWKPDIASHD